GGLGRARSTPAPLAPGASCSSSRAFALRGGASGPGPAPPLPHEVLRHATLGNARTAGLAGKLGAIKPGHKADLVLIDLNDTAYLPYNSAARQLVYTDAGRGAARVVGDGRAGLCHRTITTIADGALPREVGS